MTRIPVPRRFLPPRPVEPAAPTPAAPPSFRPLRPPLRPMPAPPNARPTPARHVEKPTNDRFMRPSYRSVPDDLPPEPVERGKGGITDVQMRRLHAAGRDGGVDHATLKVWASEMGFTGSLKDVDALLWSRLMAKLQDDRLVDVKAHERQLADEFDGAEVAATKRSAFVSGLIALNESPVVKAIQARFPNAQRTGGMLWPRPSAGETRDV